MLTTHLRNFRMVPVCMESSNSRCWRIGKWLKQYVDKLRWHKNRLANLKLRKHPCQTPGTLRLDTSPLERNVLRKMCDLSPASPMAWGFKVQSGFKNKPKHEGIQRKMLQLQIQPEVFWKKIQFWWLSKSQPEEKTLRVVGFWNRDAPGVLIRTRCILGNFHLRSLVLKYTIACLSLNTSVEMPTKKVS